MGRHDDEEDEGFSVGEVECVHATEMAIKCVMKEDMSRMKKGKEFWVPRSQLHGDSSVKLKGESGELIVTTWFAGEEGWE